MTLSLTSCTRSYETVYSSASVIFRVNELIILTQQPQQSDCKVATAKRPLSEWNQIKTASMTINVGRCGEEKNRKWLQLLDEWMNETRLVFSIHFHCVSSTSVHISFIDLPQQHTPHQLIVARRKFCVFVPFLAAALTLAPMRNPTRPVSCAVVCCSCCLFCNMILNVKLVPEIKLAHITTGLGSHIVRVMSLAEKTCLLLLPSVFHLFVVSRARHHHRDSLESALAMSSLSRLLTSRSICRIYACKDARYTRKASELQQLLVRLLVVFLSLSFPWPYHIHF